MKLSIVIPACNEQDRLGPVLEAYARYYAGRDTELIVVVNASTDRTAEVARSRQAAYEFIRVIEEPARVGKGGAIVLGFQVATGDIIGFVDADGATGPEAFQDLVDHIGEAGAIIACRWHPDSTVDPPQPLSRRVASRIFNRLVALLFNFHINDTQCGAKVMRADALKQVLPSLGLTSWAFDVDLLFQLRRAGYAIVERPTVWRDQAGSKVRVVRASLEMLVAITRLRLLYSPFRFLVRLYDISLGRYIFHRPAA